MSTKTLEIVTPMPVDLDGKTCRNGESHEFDSTISRIEYNTSPEPPKIINPKEFDALAVPHGSFKMILDFCAKKPPQR